MSSQVVVIGGTGYGGAELMRHLLHHPAVELLRVTAADNIGKRLGDVHFNLHGLSELRYQEMPAADAADGADLVFLGLPHRVSARIAPQILRAHPEIKLIDLSGDFRLLDLEAYEKFYGPHPHPEYLGTFAYGLPELFRERIRGSLHVASPGCFATATILALAAVAGGGLLNGAVRVVACTGSSGSGANPSLGTHHPLRSQNLRTYKVLKHQHVPEIVQCLGQLSTEAQDFRLDFVPVSAPLARGILVTAFLDVAADVDEEQISALYDQQFSAEPFIKIVKSRMPEVIGVAGTNFVEVGFQLSDAIAGHRTLVCMSAVDNLIKGGAGQAIQSMNIMLGVDERTTLSDPGLWP